MYSRQLLFHTFHTCVLLLLFSIQEVSHCGEACPFDPWQKLHPSPIGLAVIALDAAKDRQKLYRLTGTDYGENSRYLKSPQLACTSIVVKTCTLIAEGHKRRARYILFPSRFQCFCHLSNTSHFVSPLNIFFPFVFLPCCVCLHSFQLL